MTTRDERDLTQHIIADFGRKVRRMVQESRRAEDVRIVEHKLSADSSGSAAVEHLPYKREDVGSNPTPTTKDEPEAA